MRLICSLFLISLCIHLGHAQEVGVLPSFEISHDVVPFAFQNVSSTMDGVIHHFDNHPLPSVVYLEQDDANIYVVHQDAPFTWQHDTLAFSPERDYRRMKVLDDSWYFLSQAPYEITRIQDLLFSQTPELLLSTDQMIHFFQVVDLDGSGTLEIITAADVSSSPILVWELIDGFYQVSDTVGTVTYARNLDVADFNSDGHFDVVSDGKIFLSDGPSNWEVVHSFSSFSLAVEIADFDGDGDDDIASVDYYGNEWTLTTNVDGSNFATEGAIMFPGNGPLYASDLISADANGDGLKDVFINLSTNDNIYLWLNGVNDMESPTILVPDGNPGRRNLQLVDLDLDGDLDWFGTNPYRYVTTQENTQISLGCTDSQACNFDPDANENDSSCAYPEAFYDCDGNCLQDNNGNGLCDELEVLGCMDPEACNFDESATLDDMSCQAEGCNDPNACNFNGADVCDNACIFPAIENDCAAGVGLCGPGTQWNAASQLCEIILPGDLDFDGCAGVTDLLELLSYFGDCVDNSSGPFYCGVDHVSFDGDDYATVLIGQQCWFQQNLRSTHFTNGDEIAYVASNDEYLSNVQNDIPAQCFADYDSLNFSEPPYGRFYNGYAVIDSRLLCPVGWHVATDADWQTLEMALGMSADEADATGWRGTNQGELLKSSPTDEPGWDGTNASGFSLFSTGWFEANGTFHAQAKLWAPAQISFAPFVLMRRQFYQGNDKIAREQSGLGAGFPVRCTRDNP